MKKKGKEMKLKNKKIRKIVVSVTGVTLALLLLVGSNLGLFAQATEAQNQISSGAVLAENNTEDVASIDQATPDTSGEKTEEAPMSDASEPTSESEVPASKVTSEKAIVDALEEPATFAAADSIGVTITTDANHPELTNTSVKTPVVYTVTISNKDLYNEINASSKIKLSLEGGIIIATSADAFLTNTRSGSLQLPSGVSELNSFETGLNVPIAPGSGVSFTVRAYNNAPTDMKLTVQVDGTNADGTTLQTIYTDTLQYTADYGYITDLPNYTSILGVNSNFSDNNLVIGGSSNGRAVRTSYWNGGTSEANIGYFKDYQIVRKLSEEDAVHLQSQNNRDSQLTDSLGTNITIPYVLQQDSSGNWELVWNFGALGPAVLLNGFQTMNNYNNYVDPSFFTTAYIGKKYTFYDGIRDGSTVISAKNNNKTGSVTIVEVMSVENQSDYTYGVTTSLDGNTLYDSTRKNGNFSLAYWFSPGNIKPTDLPFADITTTLVIPSGIELQSMSDMQDMKINKIEAFYPDTGAGEWRTLLENNSGFITDENYIFAATDASPTLIRYTANKWTSSDGSITVNTRFQFGIKDEVVADTSFEFYIQDSTYKTATSAGTQTKNDFFYTTINYKADVKTVLTHDFKGTVSQVSKNYMIGEKLSISDSLIINAGVLNNGFYFMKLPKGISIEASEIPAEYTLYKNYSDSKYDILIWKFGDIDPTSTESQKDFTTNFLIDKNIVAGDYTIEVGFGSLDGEQKIDLYNPSKKLNSVSQVDSERPLPAEIKDSKILDSQGTDYYSYSLPITIANSNSYGSTSTVKGATNTAFSTKGTSVSGSSAEYEFTFSNTGNLNYKSTEIVSILPHVNDTLTGSSTLRNSQYGVKLTNVEVLRNGVVDNNLVLFYSQSSDPERYDVSNNKVGSGKWVTFLSDISTAKAIKIVNDQNSVIAPGDVITIRYKVTVPFDVSENDIAYNSAAVHTTDASDNAVNFETPISQLKAEKATNVGTISGIAYGNYTGGTFQGLNGVKFKLYKKDASNTYTPVTGQEVYSTTGIGGQEGLFGFGNLEYGTYKIMIDITGIDGTTFFDRGNYSISAINAKTGWVVANGVSEFTVDDSNISGGSDTISNLEANVKLETTVKGKINFLDKFDTVVNSQGVLEGYKVKATSTDGATVYGTGTADANGEFAIVLENFTNTGNVKISLALDSSNTLVLPASQPDNIVTNVTVGKGTNDNLIFALTDKDVPNVAIVSEKQHNPSKISATVTDISTPTTAKWEIIDIATNAAKYSGNFTNTVDVTSQLGFLLGDAAYGEYTFRVIATDLAKNETIKDETFYISPSPTINANDITYIVGSTISEAQFLTDIGYSAASQAAGGTIVSETNDFSTQVDLQTEGTYTVTLTAKDSFGLTTTKKITVKVEYQYYYLEFDANTGVGTMTDQKITYNTKSNINANTFTKVGYKFVGWNTQADIQGDGYAPGAQVLNLVSTADGKLKLFAEWKANDYLVKFDGNGATDVAMSDQAFTYDQQGNLNSNTYARDGYHFKNWNTEADGSGTSYTDVQSVKNLTATDSITLFAQWTKNSYTVKFNGNGSTSVAMPAQAFTYDDAAKALSKNTYVRPGYKFLGWTTVKDAATVNYTDEQSVANLTKTDNGVVELFAKWEADTYIVKFDANTGSGTMNNLTLSHDIPANLTQNAFTKTGYHFVGWSETATGAVKYTEKQSVTNLTNNSSIKLFAKWEANQYTVKFDANGGAASPAMADQTFKYDDAVKALSANTYTRSGYSFAGWSTTKTGNPGIQFSDKEDVKNLTSDENGTVQLYAHWTAGDNQVIFNGNTADGSAKNVNDPIAGKTDDSVDLKNVKTPTRVGYKFVGWFDTNASTGGTQMPQSIQMPAGGITYFARWEAIKYQVVFDNNTAGATGSMAAQTFTYDTVANLSSNGYAKTGYTFAGWNVEKNGSNPKTYTNNEAVSNLAAQDGDVVTLYAQWTENKYEVEFDGNGYTGGSMPNQQFTYDSAQNLSANAYDRTGYEFKEWSTSSTGNATQYSNKQNVNNLATNGKVVLYAQWTANNYTVKFDKNASNATGSMADQAFTYNTSTPLNANSFARDGYSFAYWTENSDGSGTKYYDNDSVSTLSASKNGVVKLYANWSAGLQTISFNANATNVTNMQPAISKNTGTQVQLKGVVIDPVRAGYDFVGWYDTNALTGGTKMPDEITMPAGGKIYYARWEGQENSVIFNGNGGTSLQADKKAKTGETVDLSGLKAATLDGYQFTKWYTAATGGTEVPATVVMPDGGVTYYAQWAPNSYEVAFDGNAANVAGSMSNQSFVYDVAQNLSTAAYTRTGYTLTGWNTQANGKGTNYALNDTVNNLTKTQGDVVTLYAVWKENSFTVNFDGNQATSGSMAPQAFKYDTAQKLTANAYSRTGYTFQYWATSSDGSGTKYTNEQSVSNLVSSSNGSITLYAIWLGDGEHIIFDANGENAETKQQAISGKTGDNIVLSGALDAERVGYVFDGWYDKASGGSLMPSSVEMPAGGKTYYAHWTAINYEVEFNNGNAAASGSMVNQSFAYDESKKLTANQFSRGGYTFKGWNTELDGSGTNYQDKQQATNLSANDASTIILYAQWDAISYTIKFNKNGGTNGTMQDQTMGYDKEENLYENQYARTDYKFDSWNTQADGLGTTYSDKAAVKNLVSTKNGTIELFAQWKDTYSINASDFIVEVTDVRNGLSDSDLISKANAAALTKADGTTATVVVENSEIVDAAGTYPVTFESNGEKITINATVKDADNLFVGPLEAIHANNIGLKSTEVAATSKDTYIQKSSAKAWTKEFPNQSRAIETVDASRVQSQAGTYEIYYSTAQGTQVKAYVAVTDADNGNVENQEAIQANNIVVKLADAAALSPTDYVDKSSAKAWKANTVLASTLGVVADDSAVNTSQVGTYKVTYKTTTTAQTEVVGLVTIYDGDHVDTNLDTKEAIQASDFITEASQVSTLGENEYITNASAGAWIFDGDHVLGSSTVTKADYNLVEAKKGIYPVKYSTDAGTSVVAYVAVGDGDVVASNIAKKEVIQANNFIVKGSEVDNGINVASYIEKASESAWTWDEKGQMIDLTNITVDDSQVSSAPGTYPVEFTTANGSSVQVWATVQTADEITVDLAVGDAIQADNFKVKKYLVEAGLSDQYYKDESEVLAWTTDGLNNPVGISNLNASAVEAKLGQYPVTFETANGTTVTITVEVIANNVRLVTFDGNGATVDASPKEIGVEEPNTTMGSVPAQEPSRVGHTFNGWNTQADGNGSPFDLGSPVPGDMIVYAQWLVNSYQLSFDSRGGDTTPGTQTLVYNTLATKPSTDPFVYGHSFIGWFTQPVGGTRWDFATTTMPGVDTILYAQYAPNPHVVTFNFSGAGTDQYQNVNYGATVVEPQTPYLFGYTFTGWYDANGDLWNFATTMPDNDITLTAEWVHTEHTLTLMTYDLQVIKIEKLYAGDQVALVNPPNVGGHHFAGWVVDGTVSKWTAYMKMQDNDLTLIATYDKNPEVVITESKPAASKPTVTKPSSSSETAEVVGSAKTSDTIDSQSSSSAISESDVSSSTVGSSAVIASSSAAGASSVISGVVTPIETLSSWSLLSLILVAVGTILSVVLIIISLRKNKTTSKRIFGIIGAILGIVALIIFIVISDFSASFVFFNNQTLIFIAMLVLQFVMCFLGQGKKDSENDETDDENV